MYYCEVPIDHSYGVVEQAGAVGLRNLEFREIWDEDTKLVVISILMTFKAIEADEPPKEWVYTEKRTKD